MPTPKKVQFQCHHCTGNFSKEVQVVEPKHRDARIVYETTTCPHCGKSCQLELYADEASVISISRQGDSFTTPLASLDNKVFPTRPLP